ncbi:BglG family transcription antiterminator [Microcella sp.]|uniref:BglG family transcription antiterminator n=1 Tax=Microcella sp. TaxID=1913979 RepID=UPI002567BE7C|nr:BglG family transcription antiterminator [Microcella sp.]MBX9471563.1 BglG family transcription antiterminator [Microcella sp.]
MADKYGRMLELLFQADDWVTATELAEQLGVTTRSVRSYVAAAKSAAHPRAIVAASTAGYRLNREQYADFLDESRERSGGSAETPQDRVHHLVRRLTESQLGIDVHELADSLFVSESTIEADLRKVKALVEGASASLERRGSVVRLTGSEGARRRLLSSLVQSESTQGMLDLDAIESEFALAGLGAFKTELIEALDGAGFFINEYGIDAVILHVAIAVDRARRDQHLPDAATTTVPERHLPIVQILERLTTEHFEVALTLADTDYLARLLITRVIAPGNGPAGETVVDEDDVATVRRIVDLVLEEYVVDFRDEAFITRLAIHLGNLVARARENAHTRNPLTRSIKSSYPLIFDIAVYIASIVQRERGITVDDDEISYIALHLGSHLERVSRREERVSCTIVCPSYYDLHTILRTRIERELGGEVSVEFVVTRTDVDPRELTSDLVISTIPTTSARDGVVVVQPFLTDDDIDAIRAAASRVRRQRRRARITDELLEYFDERLFFTAPPGDDPESIIRGLGAALVDADVIDEAYVAAALERERMSSTAFTETLAVPHAMGLTAERTAIAIALSPAPIAWGDARVSVIAFIAFSAEGRARFQPLFDQFIEVFASRRDVAELVRDSSDFAAFIEQLAQLIERG